MTLLTAEDRALVDRARQIKAKQRKQARAERPKKVAPARTDKPTSALRERRPRQRDNTYLKWIRRLPCVICARQEAPQYCATEAAHIRSGYPEHGWSHTGKGEKPDDWRTLPLCEHHHRTGPDAQHKANESKWWDGEALYPPAACERLRRAYEAGENGLGAIIEIQRWVTDRG